jgi:hypothetical protein
MRFGFPDPMHPHRSELDVLHDRLVGKEVELLEDHADIGPQPGQ